MTLLLYNHMRYDPAYPNHPAADRLVLSAGHACPIVYAAATNPAAGFPFFPAATGSLGQGLSIANSVALVARKVLR